ncbi:MAG: thioredoxin domain-containing protein [Candidatus Hydrogenedentes bacterium]|nr:thioredoxin domain-containing protein [Candidatus Hydrogenedentota bacterium]
MMRSFAAFLSSTAILFAGLPLPGCSGPGAVEMEESDLAEPEHKYTNRLIGEMSPYLLQHAHNPVDWYPWGEEAFAKAREEGKPIFLSVGYSSCHWCHVMERESFENEEVAELLNANFVSIKVDREERPDVDEIYMAAVQALTRGGGGWPMSVFLTTDLKPFHGGTYFPKPQFVSLLRQIATLWNDDIDRINGAAAELTNVIDQNLSGQPGEGTLTANLLSSGVEQLGLAFDSDYGGFSPAPKFPSGPSVALLLREHARTGEAHLLDMATLTLDRMALGGMYDHLGGGFARYSTDERWLVPHFEKMLYDNAQLAQAYLEGYQVTKSPLYKRVIEETFEYILRDMCDSHGGFHTAEDADSESEEGKFYIWTRDEILKHLGDEDGAFFADYYQVKSVGNFDSREHYHAGQNILHLEVSLEAAAEEQEATAAELGERVEALKDKLLAIRSERVRPGVDDKVLTSLNALMISAFAQGYQVLGDERYRAAAVEAAHFIVTEMKDGEELLRAHRAGKSKILAFLNDYAYMTVALVDLYEATFDPQWLTEARTMTDGMLERFWDEETNGFYFTSDDHKNLIVRTRPTQDGATPSGNSMAALGMLRLAKLLDRADYYDKAKTLMEGNHELLARAPRAFLKMLGTVDFLLYPPKEIAIAGTPGSEDVNAFLSALHARFVPNKVIALIDPSAPNAESIGEQIPLLMGKTLISGEAAAYVCENYACKRPVTTPEAFLKQLGE